jgi:hypothetical protein
MESPYSLEGAQHCLILIYLVKMSRHFKIPFLPKDVRKVIALSIPRGSEPLNPAFRTGQCSVPGSPTRHITKKKSSGTYAPLSLGIREFVATVATLSFSDGTATRLLLRRHYHKLAAPAKNMHLIMTPPISTCSTVILPLHAALVTTTCSNVKTCN